MSESSEYGIKLNNIQSSLKFFNFEGMDKDKIIEKYEETLCQREKQIRDIAYEIGVINEKLVTSNERIKILEDENQMLHNKLLKKDTLLEQELTNKDIMFIKINNLQNENDRLQKKLQEHGIEISSTGSKDKKSFFSGLMDKFSNKNSNDKNSQTNNQKDKPAQPSLIPTTTQVNPTYSNNKKSITAISATLTQDLLNNIDLNKVNLGTSKKEESSQSNEKNYQQTNNFEKNRIPIKANPLSRLSLQSDKRLASENIDYEPVFK